MRETMRVSRTFARRLRGTARRSADTNVYRKSKRVLSLVNARNGRERDIKRRRIRKPDVELLVRGNLLSLS